MKAVDLTFKEADQIIKLLKAGKVGILPTDTIYGIVGLAFSPQTVEEIYSLRKRTSSKPFIILISSTQDLKKFGVKLNGQQKDFLEKNWPNPLSVILAMTDKKFTDLHRGKNSLAFRMPDSKMLLGILEKVGPLVAPSANLENRKPAETINEAKKYFGDQVSFYADGGILKSKPSTVVQLYQDGSFRVLRQGIYNLPRL